MAICNCTECGKEVSTKADKCPNCGAPVKKSISQKNIGCGGSLLIVFIIFVIIGIFAGQNKTETNIPSVKNNEVLTIEQAKKIKHAEEVFLKSKAGKIWKKHGWDKDVCRSIANGRISIGMAREQVRMAWGKPESINTTKTASTTYEQWVYGVGQYVYFENGIMTTLQQSN